jgi:hypothetical protein
LARDTEVNDKAKAGGSAPAGDVVRPASAARETLSWIRALASQFEDDLSGSTPEGGKGGPGRP